MRLQAAILALIAVTAPAVAADTPAVTATAAAAPAAAQTDAGPAPKTVIPESKFDFGKVSPNGVLKHSFVIRNEGTAPLVIKGIAANCKCTALDWDKEIAPGASGKIEAAVDARMLEGASEGLINVTTNDPQMPRFTLTTEVEVHSQLLANPGFARWNTVQGEKEGTIGETVFAADGADFHVLKVNAPEGIRTAFRPATGDELRKDTKGPQWRIEATLPSSAPVGPIEGYLEVVTDHPVQPVMRIPVSGFVRPVVHVTPPVGDFGSFSFEGQPRSGTFRFQDFATEKMAVDGITTTIKGAKITTRAVEEGRTYDIGLEIPPGMKPGAFDGAVRIRYHLIPADAAAAKDARYAPRSIEVPVKGVVEPAAATAAKPPGGAAAH